MSADRTSISRRAFAGGALATLAIGQRALAAPPPTAESPMGPFYPSQYRGEADADLTRLKGHARRAQGSVIEVSGRVLDRHGNPLRGARIELWQANAAGRYDHPNDVATASLDPDFQSYASLVTGADGGWRIVTVKPGGYASPIGQRTPHIHFDVRGRAQRLIAQMYFPEDDAANRADRLYRGLGGAAVSSLAQSAGDARYRWDIVLQDG